MKKAHIKRIVSLSKEEVATLERKARSPKNARAVIRARVLLLSHKRKTYEEIVHILGCSQGTIANVRKRYRERGSIEAALRDAPRPGSPRKITPEHEAFVVATACTRVPKGHDHWTLRALRQKVLQTYPKLKAVSHERIRQILLEANLKPWRHKGAARSARRA